MITIYSSLNYYYIPGVSYDAAGRVDEQWLGAAAQASTPVLVQDPNYNPWNVQGGRLQWMHAGTYDSQAGLLDLSFVYDNVGNIVNIVDTVNSGQKQCFGYDALDRLVSAKTGDAGCNGIVGNGEYADEGYSYRLDKGSLDAKTGMGTYIYGETEHLHAVIATSAGWTFQYDANGNQTRRDPPGTDYYDYQYDAENRLSQAKKNGSVMATFTYDGAGARVKGTVEGVTTTFVGGGVYEVTGSGAVTKYYLANGGRLAQRNSSGLTYLFGDQLGSTSVTYRVNDGQTIRQLYKAWGEPRYASASLPTPYTYTGQYSYTDDIATPGTTEGFGLMFYNARWFDPALGRWSQPDTIVPDPHNPLDWDRYAALKNNPVKYVDPTGHIACQDEDCESGQRSTKDVPLTQRGQLVYGLYAQLKWKSGWWNGESCGSLTPDAFLGLSILWERGGNLGVEDILTEAAKNQLWMDTRGHGGHEAYCQSEPCVNGVYNFIGAYGGGHTDARVSGLLKGRKYHPVIQSAGETSESLMAKAGILGRDLTTYARSRVAFNGNVPYHWGNDAAFYNQVTDVNASQGLAVDQIVFRLYPDFIVYTLNQSAYWSNR